MADWGMATFQAKMNTVLRTTVVWRYIIRVHKSILLIFRSADERIKTRPLKP